MSLKVAFHPEYIYPLPEGHRFPMEKYGLLKDQLLYEGTLNPDDLFTPEEVSDKILILTHTEEYLDKLHTQTLSYKEIRNIGFPMTPRLVHRGKIIANGTLTGAMHALSHGIALNIAGGTHHAFANHGEGFCVFNDIAIASNYLLHENLVQKILIVDLDVHQGNGTARIFEENEAVFTFSMHGAKNYPLRKEVSNLDLPLRDKTADREYLQMLNQVLPRLLDTVQPDIVFYLSGVDVLETDKLGRLGLSKQGCAQRDRVVFSLCKQHRIPVIVSMGGGYSFQLRDIIDAHANTFREAKNIFD
jgi:acetoin utilization deacetylase AcuC-like enzyme